MMKVAVVTGASSGIGAAIVSSLSTKGHVVVGLARRVNRVEELAQKCTGKIYAKNCDVSNEKQVMDTFNWINNTLGGVDVLVNSAGVSMLSGIVDGQMSDWKKIIDTNILGLSLCCREALKTMKQRGDNGFIININSIAGHCVPHNMNFGMYSASKHAVTALTESLRYELLRAESGIRATSISPGTVYTPMVQKIEAELKGTEFVEKDPSEIKSSRYCLVSQDIADAVSYVLSTPDRVQISELTIQPIGQTRG